MRGLSVRVRPHAGKLGGVREAVRLRFRAAAPAETVTTDAGVCGRHLLSSDRMRTRHGRDLVTRNGAAPEMTSRLVHLKGEPCGVEDRIDTKMALTAVPPGNGVVESHDADERPGCSMDRTLDPLGLSGRTEGLHTHASS